MIQTERTVDAWSHSVN